MPLTRCTGMGLRDDPRRLCPHRAWARRQYMRSAYRMLEKGSLTRMAIYARTEPATEMCMHESLATPYTALQYRRSNRGPWGPPGVPGGPQGPPGAPRGPWGYDGGGPYTVGERGIPQNGPKMLPEPSRLTTPQMLQKCFKNAPKMVSGHIVGTPPIVK